MKQQDLQTIIKVADDYRVVKYVQQEGYKCTYYKAHCNHCDFVQDQNRGGHYGNIVYHLKSTHNIEYKD